MDYITENGGYIHDAIDTQVWSGEANVHVSIVNWSREPAKTYYLNNEIVHNINSSLRPHISLSLTPQLLANSNSCFEGIQPAGKGFIITADKAQTWIAFNSSNEKVIKYLIDAMDLSREPGCHPTRWIIDFNDMTLEQASCYIQPCNHLKETVKLERGNNRRG